MLRPPRLLPTARLLRVLALGTALALAAAPRAWAQAPRTTFPVINGAVNVKVLSGGTLYVGGSFGYIGGQTGGGVPVDSTTAAPLPTFPKINGTVTAVVPDGSGGWYIGGLFSTVDETPRSNLAHVLADRTLAAWNPGADGQVYSLALGNGVLYAGGAFANAGGAARARIAAIDTASGSATAWNPGANDLVRALLLNGPALYAAGRFTTIGGAGRNRIAALDTATAAALAWNPGAGSEVLALAARPGLVYASGTFTSIGFRARNRLAAIDSVTGVATGWNPNANSQIFSMALGDTSMVVGGTFTTIGGASRLRIAEIPYASSTATAFAPNANGAVNAVAISGGSVYAGGDFSTIGGQSRSRLAELDPATGLARAWNPIAYGSVIVLCTPGDGVIYAGGSMAGMGGWARNNLAAIDAATGNVLPWNPNVGGQVLSLAAHGGVLYIGGQFATVSGQPRSNAAAVDALTGALRPWDPSPSDQVTALAANDTSVYLGGTFLTVGSSPRSSLAQVDAASGAALPWAPDADGQVFDIRTARGVVFVAGSFATVGGQARNNIAALDPVTGAANAWDPDPNGTVRTMVVSCDRMYVAGFFTTIGGVSRNRIAELDLSSGFVSGWNPNANGQVFDLELADGVLYAGGVFSTIGGQSRLRLASLDVSTGLATSWNPAIVGTVRAVTASDGSVFVGGSLTASGSTPIANLAALTSDPSHGCATATITPATLPDGTAGTAYSHALSASGGVAPYCWSLTDGALPDGLTLSPAGVVSGTPTGAIAASFGVTTTDARGCTSSRTVSLTTFGGPITSDVAPDARGLCVNPAHPFVTLPLVYTRSDTTPARLVSVTFQLDTSRVVLHTPADPAASVRLGSWFDAFPNALLQVTSQGGGRFTADATILGNPCGLTTGGQVIVLDLAAAGPDGFGTVSVMSVRVRDCANAPVPVGPGAPDSVRIQFAPLAIAPASLPAGVAGATYHQVLTASGGTPTYTFTLLSGSLPPGVTLSAAGELDGVPTHAGVDTFTVGVADSFGCAGLRAYSITVGCPAIALAPAALADGVTGDAYAATFSASGATPPLTFAVLSGALPDGVALDTLTGALTGTPTTPGTSAFDVSVTDAHGCGATRTYAVTIFAAPVTDTLAADAAGLCLSNGHPRIGVPFILARTDTAGVRHARITFQLDASRLALATPAAPESSLHAGAWFAGFAAPTVTGVAGGAGEWIVDLELPPGPCGPANGDTVLVADVVATGPDGAASIAVTRVKLFGCAGDTLPVLPGAATALNVSRSGPAAPTDVAAVMVATGNGALGTTGITVTWSNSSDLPVTLFRAPWASYPGYAAAAGPDSSLAPGGPWTLVASGATSPYVDHPGTRGCWYYIALTTDSCGNYSAAANRSRGTLDYLLGDVSDAVTPGTGNNAVGLEDVTLLGAHYGITGGTLAARGVQYLDVGPTTDLALDSRPVPDAKLDFDDLMVFAGNFQAAATAPARATGATHATGSAAVETFRIDAPSLVSAGQEFTVPLSLAAGGRMHGFAVKLAWDPNVVEPVGMASGGFAESQGGLALSPGPGRVDAAQLGRGAAGFTGDGVVATFRFRALRTGDAQLRIDAIRGRDAANRPLPDGAIALDDALAAPNQTLLLAPAPNPFVGRVALTFSLARAGDAELSIYDLNGRRVRTLVRGRLDAGVHHLAWDGLDDSRTSSAPGVYYVRFAAGEQHFTTRLVHLK